MNVKRQLLRLAVLLPATVLLSLLAVGVVFADNGPHGAYTATTDACAGCHRAHTGQGDPLLKIAGETYDLCETCHDGTGAFTNVYDGLYGAGTEGTDGMSLLAGGFTNATMNVDLADPPAPTTGPTTSIHTYDLSAGTLWGAGAAGSGSGEADFALTCVKCHNPHGNASSTDGPTYRILRSIPRDSGGAGVDVSDETPKWYTIADETAKKYWGQTYDSTIATAVNNWCGQCHDRIHHANTGDSAPGIYVERHITEGDVTGFTYPSPPGCETCHAVHGTVASMAGFAADVEAPGDSLDSGTMGSALLRLNNRGVCFQCHGSPD